jgi:Glycosyl hydrolase family 26
MSRLVAFLVVLVALVGCTNKEWQPVPEPTPHTNPGAPSGTASSLIPPAGKLLHGVFVGGGLEDDPTPERLARYENAVGKRAAWVYFSNNWFTSRAFPKTQSETVRDTGSVPFIRLMLRSSTQIGIPEPTFTLERVNAGEFDAEFRAWGDAAKAFKTPLIVEFGTEVNGRWFAWNGVWHGANPDGPKIFREAYRRIVTTIQARGATNIAWVFHVAGGDDPNESWNRLEKYYPGSDVIDWLGLSAYGAQDPTATGVESLATQLDRIVPRLERLAPGKPILLLEFGTVANHPGVSAARWTADGLDAMIANRWPALRGFAWWNSRWTNDGDPAHDSRMLVEQEPDLARAMRERLGSDRVLERVPNP